MSAFSWFAGCFASTWSLYFNFLWKFRSSLGFAFKLVYHCGSLCGFFVCLFFFNHCLEKEEPFLDRVLAAVYALEFISDFCQSAVGNSTEAVQRSYRMIILCSLVQALRVKAVYSSKGLETSLFPHAYAFFNGWLKVFFQEYGKSSSLNTNPLSMHDCCSVDRRLLPYKVIKNLNKGNYGRYSVSICAL